MENLFNDEHPVYNEAKKYFKRIEKHTVFLVWPSTTGKRKVDATELCGIIAEKKLKTVANYLYGAKGVRIVSKSKSTNSIYFTCGGDSCRLSDHNNAGFAGRQFIVTYKSDVLDIVFQIMQQQSWQFT